MDMANQAFLRRLALASNPMDDCIADASFQHAWRAAATRTLLQDLRADLQGSDAATDLRRARVAAGDPAFAPAEDLALIQDTLFLAGPGCKKSGERRRQILAGFLEMLESRKDERVTTLAVARHVDLSEAALYRHFESRTVMLECLIVAIEDAVLELCTQADRKLEGRGRTSQAHAALLITLLLRFAEDHPGVARVMAGDVLVLEEEFLRQRMMLFFARFEEALADVLRDGEVTLQPLSSDGQQPDEAAVVASALCAFSIGRLSRYAQSGFRLLPSADLDACLATMLG